MRITIVLPPRATTPVGGYRVQYELADYLAALGHDPLVVHPWSMARPEPRRMPRCAAAVLRADLLRRELVHWHHFHPRARVRMVPWLSPAFLPRADVTVLTAWQTSAAIPSRTSRSGPLAQVVYDYEHWSCGSDAARQDIADALRRPDVQHIATSGVVRQMLSVMGVPVLATVPPGLVVERFHCRKPPEERSLTVGFAYRREPHKGLADLVPALEELHERFPDVRFRCFGDPEGASLPGWVADAGYVPDDELVTFYNECAIFVLPSHYEGWGLPAAEAMACGAALVTTDCGGVRDFVRHERTALVVPPRDPRAMVGAVARLLERPALRCRLANAGAARMATMGWETAAKAMEAVLGEMAPGPAPARPQPRDRAASPASKDLLRLAQWKAAGLAERACSLGVVPRARAGVHLGVVLAGWDPGRTAVSLEILNRRLSNLDRATWSLVVVANNRRVRDYLRGSLSAQMRMVQGSNNEGEFSAYEEGSQALIAGAPTSPAAWIIANDRLPAYGTRYVDAVSPGLLHFTAANAVASGHVDDESRGVSFWGYRLSSYIRSNWLLISAEALARLGPLRSVTMAECDRHVPLEFPGERWPFSEWLGEEMGEWLRAWLVEPGYWTRAAPLTPASWPVLRFKALAMVNEQLLSARLVRARVPLVPWHQARLLARLPPEGGFAQQLLQLYKDHLDFGFGAEESPLARLQLAGGVFAARAGLWLAGRRLLAAARRTSELALEDMT